MAVTAMTLTEPVSGRVSQLIPRAGVAYQGHQFAPTVRAVTEDRTGSDGAVDRSRYLGAGAFTLTLKLYSGTRSLIDEIGSFLHPGYRTVLTVWDSEWSLPRQLTLRYDSGSPPIELGVGLIRNLAVSWQVPGGVWEQAGSLTELDVPVSLPSTAGLTMTTASGLVMTTASGLVMHSTVQPGEFQATNPGTVPSQWTANLYGPCSGPRFANDSAGLTLEFAPGLAVPAGSFIALDSAARSALLNNDPRSPVLASLNFGSSDWWTLQPGVNELRYYPSTGALPAYAQVFYRPAWLFG